VTPQQRAWWLTQEFPPRKVSMREAEEEARKEMQLARGRFLAQRDGLFSTTTFCSTTALMNDLNVSEMLAEAEVILLLARERTSYPCSKSEPVS
jgi:hypothetical protein